MTLGFDREAPRSARFEILERLGAGGMGVVYLAFDRKRNTRVALKALPKLEPDRLLLFKREFRSLQDVQHPNLVGLGELFEEEGRWFFTLELVEGRDLLSYVRPEAREAGEVTAPTLMQTAITVEDLEHAPTQPLRELVPSASFDLERIRSGFSQLAEALMVLHAAGKVHRDIKPENALVTPEGRVVLIDFGLVLDVNDRMQETNAAAGTLAYMAPEQTSSKSLKASADWYSFGVVLYQALTGVLPFKGSVVQVVMAKLHSPPPSPRSLLPNIPEDLDLLCTKLLHPDPTERPGGDSVLRVLRQERHSTLERAGSAKSGAPLFVGRTPELEALRSALAEVRSKGAVTVALIGESGLGKTALAKRFTALAAIDQNAIVLSGRCYARESIPYKAFDGIIDALTQHLRRVESEVEQLLTEDAPALAQVFPVLRKVKAKPFVHSLPTAMDPVELRKRAFGALRTLIARLANDRPLILLIDDLQWSDADSLALLAEILRTPEEPRILVLATMRPGAEEMLDRVTAPRKIVLAPLTEKHSEELALGLLPECTEAEKQGAKALAHDAAGHPLFIQELVRALLDVGLEQTAGLDELMTARIDRLETEPRMLLELVCLAGAPITEETLARAAGVEAASYDRMLASLRSSTFVRIATAHGERALEPYHDRVREAAVSKLDPEGTKDRHQRIAKALESLERRDPEPLALHWRGAGDLAKAARYAKEAAVAAMRALAFHQAARLYRLSLELGTADDLERRALEISLGDALAAAGRPGEAAEAYLRAAVGAPRSLMIELKRRASEQRLRMGDYERGIAVAGEVLKELGLSVPGPKEAIPSLLARRAQIFLRGYDFVERTGDQIPQDLLAKVDVCYSLSTSMAMNDLILGLYFQTRHILFALESGDPMRVARALPFEVGWLSTTGIKNAARVRTLIDRARVVSERSGQPYAIAWAEAAAGVANTNAGRWKLALEQLWRARNMLRDQCTGVAFEMYTIDAYIMKTSLYYGDFVTFTGRVRGFESAAVHEGHAFMLVSQRTAGEMIAAIAADEPEEGRKKLAEVQRLLPSDRSSPVAKYLELFALGQANLYEGKTEAAEALILERWPQLLRSGIMMSDEAAIEALDLHARVMGARAAQATNKKELRRFLDLVRRHADLLDKRGWPWAQAFAAHHRAVIADLEGRDPLIAIDRAIDQFAGTDMRLHAAALRWRRAERRGKGAGSPEVVEAEAAFRAGGVKNPRAMVRLLTPAFER
jgi:eukaryotic-like serine/threonine-protein kinase